MKVLNTLFNKIKNIPMDLPKRLDNYFVSNRELRLLLKFEHFNQYLNQRIPTTKMLNYFFTQKNVLLQIRPRIQSMTSVITNLLEDEKQ